MSIKQLEKDLADRRASGLYRKLRTDNGGVDFWSNDYLGFSKIKENDLGQESGSTGSRLLSGNSKLHEEVEARIANIHRAQAALIFNSGYDANLGLLSALPQRHDTILYDELCHASIRDGIRLSAAKAFHFSHNDLSDLKAKAKQATGNLYIVVESLYSMDGDLAPLVEISKVVQELGALLIVDEAHSTGIYGPRGEGIVVELGLEDKVFARVHTFGKAIGAHGAAVVGPQVLREYLINFARSFIYTTALPRTAIGTIDLRYTRLANSSQERQMLKQIISEYGTYFSKISEPNNSPIQKVIVPGNVEAKRLSELLFEKGYNVPAVLSPTVREGQERLRISLHSFNTTKEIESLYTILSKALKI